jgi:hypothetical protein
MEAIDQRTRYARVAAAITVDAADAQDAERIARGMYGWPGDRVTATELGGGCWHVTVHRDEIPTWTPDADGRCRHCRRPEADHDRRHDLPGSPAYCLASAAGPEESVR